MFITPAFAQSGGFAEGGFGLLPIVFVMVIFYFLLIRPQQKRAKQHRELLASIRRGDKIVTTGGLTGTVVKVTDDVDTVDVEIATGVKVQIVRAMIADLRGKNEPVKAEPVKTFDKAAIRSLSKWRYAPKVVNGIAVVDEDLEMTIDFNLEK